MECNKEEAIRAKGIAESKMQVRDFSGARKIALKAQQLYSDLENISQMLIVCDVHCAAEQRLLGNETDWYGILQIEQSADEATIKKQYRRFALQLHPDKNKFPGAEAAFKLIGEAQRVLLDKGKRSLHDLKRKASVSKPAPSYRPPQRATYNPSFGVQNNFRSNIAGFNSQPQRPQQPAAQQGFSNGCATFWTACPFCNVKYQYYIQVVNKSLICQTCNKPFVAYQRSVQGAPTTTNLTQQSFPQKDVPNQGACRVELGSQGNFSAEHSKTVFPQKKGSSSEIGSEKVSGKRRRKEEVESSESCDAESNSESEEDTLIDKDGDFKAKAAQNIGSYGECPRRSDRHKQKVSYKENLSDDDDFVSHPRKAKKSESPCAFEEESGNRWKEDVSKMNEQSGPAADVKEQNKVKQKGSPQSVRNEIKVTKNVEGKKKAEVSCHEKSSEAVIDSTSDSRTEPAPIPELYEYPDPDFNDFEKLRNEEQFSVGQIWAAYDTLDAMPRFYTRIRKVSSPGFKVRITWLEPDPDDEHEIEWVNKDLPVSCGKFKLGNSENTEDRLMFSHLVCWEKGSRRDTYKIFPRKGDTWALFKNWDIKWKCAVDANLAYEYDFVEILSEFSEGVGTCVAYLGKLKGFVSLFCRISKDGKDMFQIPPGQLFRFSHMVPCFKLTGEEREGVPRGSFELDPASLPNSIEEIDVPQDLEVDAGNVRPVGSCSGFSSGQVKPDVMSEASASMYQPPVSNTHPNGTYTSYKVKPNEVPEAATSAHQFEVKGFNLEDGDDNIDATTEDRGSPSASPVDAIEIPDPEFFNFDAEKSFEKLLVGQIWSLYCDEDGLPRYYGQITKIDFDQGFKLRLRWLIPCSLPNTVSRWHDKKMPICCGRFKIKKGESQSYTSTESFSHKLIAEVAPKKNQYVIMPGKGEVWALYRKWSAGMRHSDLENCEYDIVEVLERNDLWIKVSILDRVEGFNSVFKAQVKGGLAVAMEVLILELLRFSHQIPAFRLTEERNGSLRGFWELDPAALPVHYFA